MSPNKLVVTMISNWSGLRIKFIDAASTYNSLYCIFGYFWATDLQVAANSPSPLRSTLALSTATTLSLLFRIIDALKAYSAILLLACCDVILSATTVFSSVLNSHPRYTSSVFSLTVTRSTLFERLGIFGYDLAGLTFA